MFYLKFSKFGILLLLFSNFTFNLTGQTVKKIWGTPIDKKEGGLLVTYQQGRIAYENGNFSVFKYSLPQNLKRFGSFKFDRNLKFLLSSEPDVRTLPKDIYWESPLALKGKFYLPIVSGNDKDRTYDLLLWDYNIADASFVGEPKVALTKSYITGMMFMKRFEYYISTDSTKLLTTYRYFPESKNNNVNFANYGFTVFDPSLKVLWSQDYRLTYTETLAHVEKWAVSKNGDVYLIIKVYKDVKKESDANDNPNFHYELYKFQKGQAQPKVTIIDPLQKYCFEFVFYEKAKDGIYLSGVYSNKTKWDNIDGIFFSKVEDTKTGLLKKLNYYEIPDAEIAKYSKEYSSFTAGSPSSDLKTKFLEVAKIIPTVTGGGFYIVAEEAYTHNINLNYGSASNLDVDYFYENAYAFLIGKDSKLSWVTKIPKMSTGFAGPGICSFNYFIQKDNLYLLYNDNEKNVDLDLSKPPTPIGRTETKLLRMAKIDKAGKVSYSTILNSKEDGTAWIRDFVRASNTSILGGVITPEKTYVPLILKLE